MDDQTYRKLIKELEAEVERLKELVDHDQLTGALNRHGFIERVGPFFRDAAFVEDKKEKRSLLRIPTIAILFIDIDNFKSINDTHGHSVGDDVLKRVAKIIKSTIRDADFIGRWGGEEIVVALLGAGEGEGVLVAEKIRKRVESELLLGERPITISVGVAPSLKAGTLNGMIENADRAMYEAKIKRGKNNVVCYSELA